MHAAGALWTIIVAVVVLIIAWVLVERFAPDPTLAWLGKIVIFLVAVWIVIFKVLPMIGIS